jgi:DNA-binding transcriptional ArsR family regulator
MAPESPLKYISLSYEMTESQLSAATAAAKALGHPARMRLLAMLTRGPLCVCQMTAVLRAAPSTVSEHLRELKRAGLLVEEKSGRFVCYRLAPDRDAAGWQEIVRTALAGDPVTAADGERVTRLRRMRVGEFVGSGSRLPAVPPPSRRRSERRRRDRAVPGMG